MRLALLALAALALAFGCVSQELPPEAASVSGICISECQKALLGNQDLSAGPCLLDPVPEYPGWVCDVAHQPREAIDNLPENQCQAYRSGKAQHFVEITPDCKSTREY